MVVFMKQTIEPTLKELQKLDPDYLVPCHCTGWKATNRIIETMPEKFIQSSVGTTFQFLGLIHQTCKWSVNQ